MATFDIVSRIFADQDGFLVAVRAVRPDRSTTSTQHTHTARTIEEARAIESDLMSQLAQRVRDRGDEVGQLIPSA